MTRIGRSGIAIVASAVLWGAGCGIFQDPVLDESPLIFTEVHFSPTDEQGGSDAEFIEVGNRGDEAVDASGWSIAGVGECVFPAGTSIAPGAVAVVCKDAGLVRKLAGGADAVGEVAVVGSFQGKLKNEGETLTLLDAEGRVADQIAYDATNEVVKTADDTGSSLQRPKGARRWSVAPAAPGSW